MSLGSEIFMREGRFEEAFSLLDRLVKGEETTVSGSLPEEEFRKILFHYAHACLETGAIEEFEEAVNSLLLHDATQDRARAVVFYAAVKNGDIEKAIELLDQWIRDRKLPIKGTVNGFSDLVGFLGRAAEFMTRYGQVDAGKLLIRSMEVLAEPVGHGLSPETLA
jgi:predicted translin family RNA/ssDNA-binding protein